MKPAAVLTNYAYFDSANGEPESKSERKKREKAEEKEKLKAEKAKKIAEKEAAEKAAREENDRVCSISRSEVNVLHQK